MTKLSEETTLLNYFWPLSKQGSTLIGKNFLLLSPFHGLDMTEMQCTIEKDEKKK